MNFLNTTFLKMHGLGNDFVILDQRDGPKALGDAFVQQVCHRTMGVGCDQLIVLEPSKRGDVFMRIYNGDGSESGACGNAARCVADLVMSETGTQSCSVETIAGLLPARKVEDGLIEVDMGAPKLEWNEIPLAYEMDTLHMKLAYGPVSEPVGVSMGNPHCVFFVDDYAPIDIPVIGSHFERHEAFPQRTNVEFAHVLDRTHIRLRTWERGAGLTLACGSAACATVVAAVRRGFSERKVEMELDGGTLHMEWRESDGHVLMTGPIAYVFEGVFRS